jgi:hypothetical protein
MRTRDVLFAIVLAGGCMDRPVAAVHPVQTKVETKDLPSNPDRDVDILFMIDSSGSMLAEQASLQANFPKFMDVLETIEGGMPNVHIGVATPDLGQKASDGIGTLPGGGCTGAGLDGVLRTAATIAGAYIIDEQAGPSTRNRNYTGTLGEAFAAIASVGSMGCGIEQHLGAVERALTNPANAGFLRPEAKLAVIVIADEDDCSLAHKNLFEANLDGPIINYRCTSSGVVCTDNPDMSQPGLRTSCQVQQNSTYLEPVERYASFIKSLKPNWREDVLVAGILGNNSPFEIIKNDKGQTVLDTSCKYGDNDGAYPALRTTHFLDQFAFKVHKSICGGDLSAAMVEIGAKLKGLLIDPCWEGEITDLDPDTDGLQAECTVTDVRVFPDGSSEEIALIPSCSVGQIPCWKLERDDVACHYTTTKLKLVIDRGGIVPPSDIHVRASCVTTDTDDGPVM